MPVALTHTVTHTGKRADGTHGAKSFRPLPFWGKNARKPLCRNGWRAFYHLVRMRSAVRIRPAAPRKLCNHNGYRVCFVLSFLSFVGLSNRSSNKLLLRLFLQRCNDQFGNVGIFLQQAAHQPVSGGNPPLPFSANRRSSSLLVWAYRSVTIRDCAWSVSPCTALTFPPPICSFSEALQCRRL